MNESIQWWCGWISVVFALAGYLPYIVGMVRKETVPSKASWFIWATFDTIALVSQFLGNKHNEQIIAVAVGNWFTLLFVFRYGKFEWTLLEKFCVGLAAVGVVAGLVIQEPLLTLGITLTAIFVGSFPTFQSGIFTPHEENRWAWLFFAVSSTFAAIGVEDYTIAHLAQPIVFLCVSGPMTILTWRPFTRPLEEQPPLETPE